MTTFAAPPIRTEITHSESRVFDGNWARWFNAVQAKLSLMLTPSGFVPANLTAQTGSVGTTTLLAVPATGAGFYRVTFLLETTAAGAAGTVLGSVIYNDGVAAQTVTTSTANLALLGSFVETAISIYSAASQNISYSTTVAGGAGSQYLARIRMEYLGA